MIELNESFLIQLVNFFAMILFLNYFLFKPVMEIVEKRNKALKSLHLDAAKAVTDAEKAMKEYDEKVAEAKRSTSSIMADSRQAAAAEQEKILKDARDKYSETVDAALGKIKTEIASAETGLKAEVQTLSRAMATRILGREVQ